MRMCIYIHIIYIAKTENFLETLYVYANVRIMHAHSERMLWKECSTMSLLCSREKSSPGWVNNIIPARILVCIGQRHCKHENLKNGTRTPTSTRSLHLLIKAAIFGVYENMLTISTEECPCLL